MVKNNETPEATTPATEVKEAEKKLSLADRLKAQTAHKTPGKVNTPTVNPSTPPPAKTPAPTTPSKKVGSAWNSDDDFEKETPKPTKPGEKPEASEHTETDYKSSAETVVGLTDFALTTIFGPIERYRLKKKFTEEEWPRIKEVQYADKSKLSAADLLLRNKIDKEIKHYREKLKEIELTTDEIHKNERAWYTYFKSTNSTISPGYLAAASLLTLIGSRITNTFLDD